MPNAISVGLCTYNAAQYLEEELASIAAQSRVPDEIVACDDGSQDGTLRMLENFAKHAPFPVRIVQNTTNLGRTKNFEKVVALCSGEFIALADFDDIWHPAKLATLEAALLAQPTAGYAFSDGEMIAESGWPLGRRVWQSHRMRGLLMSGFPPGEQVAALLKCGLATGAAMMIRSAIRRYVLPISPLWIQDYWISLLSSLAGRPGVAVPEPLIRYRTHPGQMTGIQRRTLWQRCKESRNSAAGKWQAELRAFQDLREHIASDPDLERQCGARNLGQLEEKLLHLSSRVRSRSVRGLIRHGLVLREAVSGRYHRFSNSWQSVTQDLLF